MTPFNRRAQVILIVSALTAAVPGVAQAPSVCPTRT